MSKIEIIVYTLSELNQATEQRYGKSQNIGKFNNTYGKISKIIKYLELKEEDIWDTTIAVFRG